MTDTHSAHPPIVSRSDWLAARRELLVREKELTRAKDALSAQRRRLPMVKVEKTYQFKGPSPQTKQVSLLDLFEGRRQLLVYHFMFDPAWNKGCDGCTGLIDAMGDLSLLGKRNTSFAMISRAPVDKLEGYRQLKGWTWPWYSSFDSDFNYDFQATLDSRVRPVMYNFKELPDNGKSQESHGMSVFFRVEQAVYHTYSTYARGCETLTDTYNLLDITPWGRQEDFEDSPPGWPQKPTYG